MAQQQSGTNIYKPLETKRAVTRILLVIAAVALTELLLTFAFSFTRPGNTAPDIILDMSKDAIAFAGNNDLLVVYNESADIWHNKDNEWALQETVGKKIGENNKYYYEKNKFSFFSSSEEYLAITRYRSYEFQSQYETEIYKKNENGWDNSQTIAGLHKTCISPDSRYLILMKMPPPGQKESSDDGHRSGNTAIYENRDGQWVLAQELPGFLSDSAFFSQNGKYLAIRATSDNDLHIYELHGDQWTQTKAISYPYYNPNRHPADSHGGAISNDGNYISVAFTNNATIFVYDFKNKGWQPTKIHYKFSSRYYDDYDYYDYYNSYDKRDNNIFSLDANYAAIPHSTKYIDFVEIFKRNGAVFEYSGTISFPNIKIRFSSFSPDGKKLAAYGKHKNGKHVIKITPLDKIENLEKGK